MKYLLLFMLALPVWAQDSWSCYTAGNTRICSGWQNGRFVTCTTYFIGNQSSTTCT